MRKTDLLAFDVALLRLREVNELLDDTDAGVCLIHLEACIASLEGRVAEAHARGRGATAAADVRRSAGSSDA